MPPEADETKTDPPSPGMSEEDVGRIVNAAVTSQLKRILPTAVTEALGAAKLPDLIAQQFAALKGADDGASDGEGQKAKPGTKSDLERTVQDLAAKLEASEKKTQAAEQARIETEQARKLDAATTAFRSSLSTKLRPELLDVAVTYWGSAQKRLTLSPDGEPMLRVKRAPYKGAPEADEDLPLAEAIPILLSSDEAKAFIPAPSAQPGGHGGAPRNVQRGSDGMPRYDAPAVTDEEKARRTLETESALKARHNL